MEDQLLGSGGQKIAELSNGCGDKELLDSEDLMKCTCLYKGMNIDKVVTFKDEIEEDDLQQELILSNGHGNQKEQLEIERNLDRICGMASDELENGFSGMLPTEESGSIDSGKEEISLAAEDEFKDDVSSEIYLNKADNTEAPLGFILKTTASGHFLKRNRDVSSIYDLGLRENDRLLAVNQKLCIYWNHWILLESLKYLLSSSEHIEKLSLIVDRQSEDGSIDVLEINLTVIRSRGDFITEVKSFLKRIHYMPRMKCVIFKKLFKCKIRHGSRTNWYMKVNENRKLEMETLTNEKDDCWAFDCYMFHALKLQKRREEPPTSTFICVLRTCHQFDSHRPYIMAKSCEKVGTMVFPSLELDVRRTESADPRFFKVTKSGNGNQILESLIYKDYYLSWNTLGNKLKLKKHSIPELDCSNDCYFEFVPF